MTIQDVLRIAIQFGVPFLFMFVFVVAMMLPLMIYMERKVCAYVQDRRGPNRASIYGIRAFGLVNLIGDVLKLLFKEDVEPKSAQRFMFRLAPLIVMASVLVVMSAVPFGDPIVFGDDAPEWIQSMGMERIDLQMVDLNAGLLFLFAIASLEVYGLILGGWSSANKYSFLGSIRGGAQMISYEVTMGLAVLGVLIVYGTASLSEMVDFQGANLLDWGIVLSPIGFLLFIIAIFAETNRNPFDLPEAEAEVVAGYHLEYSSFKFALYFMGEYVSMIVGAAIMVTLFLGGWHIPFLPTETLEGHAPIVIQVLCIGGALAMLVFGAAAANAAAKPRRVFGDRRDNEPKIFAVIFILGAIALGAVAFLVTTFEFAEWMRVGTRVLAQAGAFMGKTFVLSFFYIWVRWTLPRFRYDQLMNLGWRWMMPIGLANIVVTYVWGIEVLGR